MADGAMAHGGGLLPYGQGGAGECVCAPIIGSVCFADLKKFERGVVAFELVASFVIGLFAKLESFERHYRPDL